MRIVRWVATGLLFGACLAALGMLAAGVVLYFRYMPIDPHAPKAALGWYGPITYDWEPVEDWSAVLLVLLGLAAAVVSTVAFVIIRRWTWLVAAGAAVVGTVAAWVSLATVDLARWDQLALWAVSTDRNIGGYQAPLRDDVRFLVDGGHEVSTDSYLANLTVHLGAAVVATVVLTVAVVLVGRWGRGRQEVWRSTQAAISSTADTASGNAG